MEVICINDTFSQDWEVYFKHHGIVKPVKEKIYGIRDVVPNTKGEKGLLLVEIVNKPTPRVSPLTGMKGMAEQNWAVSRFSTLDGQPIGKEQIAEILKKSIEV